MPIEKSHQEKKVKNYLIFIIILVCVFAVFALTLVKVRFNQNDHENVRVEEQQKVNDIKKKILEPILGSSGSNK